MSNETIENQTPKAEAEAQSETDAEYLQKSLTAKADQAQIVIDSLDAQIAELTETNPEKAESLRKKAERLIKKSLFYFGVVSAIFIAGAAANYERTRYKVAEHLNPDTSISYIHEDEETTRILEFLSGRIELDRQTRFEIARTKIVNALGNNKIKIPEKLNTAQEEEFVMIVTQMSEARGGRQNDYLGYLSYMINNRKDWLDIYAPVKLDQDDDVYAALWRVERLSGNPRVRWIDVGSSTVKSLYLKLGASAFHYPLTNTIYLTSPDTAISRLTGIERDILSGLSVRDFIAESSHTKQENERPISSSVTWLRDGIITLIQAVKTGDLSKAYDQNYRKPGAFEHEAHSVIEPGLRREFNKELKH